MSSSDSSGLGPAMLARLALRIVLGVAVIGAMIFGPAGTWRFWPGWIWAAAFLLPMLVGSVYFVFTDPELIVRRMQMRESESAQKKIIAASSVVMLGGFLVPGFDHRFGWSDVPMGLVIAADAFVLAGYLFVLWVLKTNSYASRTIRVETDQPVIDTGPYALVRHPMYTGMTVMMLASPIGLGSWWAVLPFLLVPVLLVLRIRNEEAVLREELAGYEAYCERVRWRLVPGLW